MQNIGLVATEHAIGLVTTEIGVGPTPEMRPGSVCMVHGMGSGVMASILAMENLANFDVIDTSRPTDLPLPNLLSAYETIIINGWSPVYRAAVEQLPAGRHRVLVHWHTCMSGIEQMGEAGIFADAFNCKRVERFLWTGEEVRHLDCDRFLHFPNVAVREPFRWLVEAPTPLPEFDPAYFNLLVPTVNRQIKNGLTCAFAAYAVRQSGVPLRLHVTDAFGRSERCGPALRALLGQELVVHPSLPVRAPRWGGIIKSSSASLHLSFSESYCYAAIESIVGGVPAVLTPSIPFASQVRRELPELVVEPTDVQGIRDAILSLHRLTPAERRAIADTQLRVFRRYNRQCAERLITLMFELGIDLGTSRKGLQELL